MGQELPAAVPSRIHALEPDGELPAPRVPSPVTCPVASVGDRDVSVELDLHRVEIASEVRDFANRRQPLRFVLDAQRRAAGGPAVAVREAEVARAGAIEEGD